MDEKHERIALLPKEDVQEKPSKVHQTLTLLACMYLHFMSLGLTFSLGVIYVELVRYFDTQHALAALVQSFYQGMTFLGGILFTGIVAKYDVGLPALLASLCGGVSLFVASFSVNIYMVIVFVGIIGGLCMSVNYLCAFVAVGATFNRNRKSAVASLTIATALGQTLLPSLIGYLVSVYGWTGALMITSGLMLNSVPCGVFLYVTRKPPGSDAKNPIQEQGPETKSSRLCSCSSRKDVAFVIFLFACNGYAVGNVENWFIVDLTLLRGFDSAAGTRLLSLMGASGLVGRMVGTLLLKLRPNISLPLPFSASLFSFGLGHFLVIYLTDYDGMVAGCAIRGASMGFLMCFQPGMILELQGEHKFPKAVALANCLEGIVQIVYGYLGGTIADLTGGYDLAFYIATVVAVVCGLAMFVIKCLIIAK